MALAMPYGNIFSWKKKKIAVQIAVLSTPAISRVVCGSYLCKGICRLIFAETHMPQAGKAQERRASS